jgi:hypothetical protein
MRGEDYGQWKITMHLEWNAGKKILDVPFGASGIRRPLDQLIQRKINPDQKGRIRQQRSRLQP